MLGRWGSLPEKSHVFLGKLDEGLRTLFLVLSGYSYPAVTEVPR